MFQKRKLAAEKFLPKALQGMVGSLNVYDGQSGDDDHDDDELEIAEPAVLYSDVCILCSDQGRDKNI